MKKITLLLFTFVFSAFYWQSRAQSTIHITTSGGSLATEKWISITTEANGAGTQVWGQGDGTYGNGAGYINTDISIASGTYYVNCYDKYDDGWDGTIISITAYGSTLSNNGGVSPSDGADTDASYIWGDTQEQELEASLMIVVPDPPTCLTPTALTVTGVTTSEAILGWTAGASESLWNVQYGLSGFTIGEGTIVNGVNNPHAISGLSSSSVYQFYVQADCGGGDISGWAGPFSFTTACGVFGDFTQGFESFATSTDPLCWSEKIVTTTSSPYIYVSASDTHTGTRALRMGNSGDATAQLYAITPMLTDLPAQNHRIRFFAKGDASITFEVGTMTDPTNASTFTSVQTLVLTTSHQEFIVNFNQATTDGYIAFKATYSSTYYFVSIDDVVWEPIPSCPAPTMLSASNITYSGATFSWNAGASEALWNVEYGQADFTQGDGTLVNGVANPYTVSGLTANTSYDYYVQADCGGDTSVWVGPFSFYTGYCIPVATSALSYINTISTTSGLTNITNADTGFTAGGYADYYDTHTIETYAGGSFDFEFSIVGGTVGAAIWVDWNHDLIFGTDEVGYTTTAYGDGPFTGTAVVPVGVPNGDYRVRVMIDYNDLNPGDDAACGFAFGRGEVEDYKMTISDAPTDAPDWYNIQWLSDGTNGSNTSLTVNAWTTVTGYAQAWEPGVTDAAGQGAGLECWIGGNPSNTDPATWPEDAWDMATYFGDSGNNDEYSINKVMDFSGTVYVASRWRLNGAPYVYGGYNNPWNGTSANSIELIVNPVLANDNCDGAVALTVNTDLSCTTVTSGTTVNATESQADDNAPCAGNNDDDVWYSFVATATTHVVTLSNVVAVTGTSTDMYMQVLSGSCGALTSVLCSDPNTATVSGLNIGETYFVRVYSYYDTARQTFDICVGTFPPPPANDECVNATVITASTSAVCDNAVSGTTGSATNSADNTCYTTYNDVWYVFTPTQDGLYFVNRTLTSGTSSTYLSIWSGTCGALTRVNTSCYSTSLSNIALTGGTTYYISVSTYNTGFVNFDLCVYPAPLPPANDACADAVNVTELPYSQTQDASAATNNAGYISVCSSNGGMNDGVWYSFTVGTAGTFNVSLSGVGSWDPQLDVYSGTCDAFTCVASADDGGGGGAETVSISGEAGVTYFVNIGYYGSSSDSAEGLFTLNITSDDGTLGTSVSELEGFNMYPNPTKDMLNIQAASAIDEVMIFNMMGQQILYKTYNSNQIQLDVQSLNTGSYIVKVISGNQVGSYNLIKN